MKRPLSVFYSVNAGTAACYCQLLYEIRKYDSPVPTLCGRPPDLWPFELKIVTPVTPVVGNVFTPILALLGLFVFKFGAYKFIGGQTDVRTGKTRNAAYCDGCNPQSPHKTSELVQVEAVAWSLVRWYVQHSAECHVTELWLLKRIRRSAWQYVFCLFLLCCLISTFCVIVCVVCCCLEFAHLSVDAFRCTPQLLESYISSVVGCFSLSRLTVLKLCSNLLQNIKALYKL